MNQRLVSLALFASLAACGGSGGAPGLEEDIDDPVGADSGTSLDPDGSPVPDTDARNEGDGGAPDGGADAAVDGDASLDPDAAADAGPPIVSTGYVYDDEGRLLGAYDEDGNVLQEHIYLGQRLVAVVREGKVLTVQTDQLGTPRAVLDGSKTVWTWDPEPFGATPPDDDPDDDGTPFVFHERFPGQRFDPASGLHQNFHRNYAPEWARYVEADPIGLAGGANLYGYVDGDPISGIDPHGLFALRDYFRRFFQETTAPAKPASKSVCDAIAQLIRKQNSLGGEGQYVDYVLPFFPKDSWRIIGVIGDGNVTIGRHESATVDGIDFNYFETAFAGTRKKNTTFGVVGNIVYTTLATPIHRMRGMSLADAWSNYVENLRGTALGGIAGNYPSLEAFYESVCQCK